MKQFIVLCANLWLLSASAAFAQTPAPLPAPNIPVAAGGSVMAIARQSDGSLIIGGNFTMIDGIARSRLARLKADGTLDANWNPSVDGDVLALAVNAAGDVYAGGRFSMANGQPHSLAVKLSGTGVGTVDPDWNPGFVGHDASQLYSIRALAIGADGTIFAGGDFHSVGAERHDNIVKLSGAGTPDPGWNPAGVATAIALALDAKGMIYVAQQGESNPPSACSNASCIGKFSTSGSGSAAADWTPQTLSGAPTALMLDAAGALYATGAFADGSNPARSLVRFLPGAHGNVDGTWQPPITVPATSLAMDDSGSLYVAHTDGITKFTTQSSGAVAADWTSSTTKAAKALAVGPGNDLYADAGAQWFTETPLLGLARLSSASGSPRGTVEAEVPGRVLAIARQPNGGTIVGGQFLRAGTVARRNLFRIAADGSLDPDWDPSPSEIIRALAVAADNSVYVGSAPRGNLQPLSKLAGSGIAQPDPYWHNPTIDGRVGALELDEHTGTLYVGGAFTTVEGTPRQNIARLSALDGSLDVGWNASVDYEVLAIAQGAPGAVYAGGGETLQQPSIAKLSTTSGNADPHWQPSLPPGQTAALAVASDGSLYAGGTYYPNDPYNKSPLRYLLKIRPDGTLDDRWMPPDNTDATSRSVSALAIDGNGSVYAGGSRLTNAWRGFVEKFAGDGAVIAGWEPISEGNTVDVLALDADGHLYIGGDFSIVSDMFRSSLAAIPVASTVTSPPHSQRPIPSLLLRQSHVRGNPHGH